LDGKVALVTGAGRGLGKAMALALAEAGSDVICVARTKDQIEETCAEIEGLGRKGMAIPTDITSSRSVDEMCSAALSEFKKIDILVNNAGIAIGKPFCEVSDEEWDQVMNINLRGAFYCSRAVGRGMMERCQGKVINISSILGKRGYQYFVSYCVSKGAMTQFTRALALEWARYNINVNAIAPGIFLTAFNEEAYADDKFRDITLKRIPFRRFGQADELGPLVVFMASRASDYMTGETVYIDGGQQVNW
jgi:NAD(P)-dependent dehydrogenase (short-subunit alcohol dehydrogenase family)